MKKYYNIYDFIQSNFDKFVYKYINLGALPIILLFFDNFYQSILPYFIILFRSYSTGTINRIIGWLYIVISFIQGNYKWLIIFTSIEIIREALYLIPRLMKEPIPEEMQKVLSIIFKLLSCNNYVEALAYMIVIANENYYGSLLPYEIIYLIRNFSGATIYYNNGYYLLYMDKLITKDFNIINIKQSDCSDKCSKCKNKDMYKVNDILYCEKCMIESY